MGDDIWHPTVEDVLEAHAQAGYFSRVRNEGYRSSFDSAVTTIQEVIDEAKAQQSVYEMAAVYLKQLIRRHPFADGNHRTGYLITAEFLSENGTAFVPDEALDHDGLANFIKQHIKFEDLETIATWLETNTYD